MFDSAALNLNSDCYCWPVKREAIIQKIVDQNAANNMASMLSERSHYFASTTIFLAPDILTKMKVQIHAIESVIKRPKYIETIQQRGSVFNDPIHQHKTQGVFMGYDFHVTEDGPRLIEINSNAGGAFIVDMVEQTVRDTNNGFSAGIVKMFLQEWQLAGRTKPLTTIAIVDTAPSEQYHYPDMCLAKTLLEGHGFKVVITDPAKLKLTDGNLYHEELLIDLVYNRLTDFDLSEPEHSDLRRAYIDNIAVITPAPHHHALYADKRNLTLLSDETTLVRFGASQNQIDALKLIPKTVPVTPASAAMMWKERRKLFFKPTAGFGSRGAFRGAKLTKKVWSQILDSDYIAQDLIAPPVRAVTVDGKQLTLKFDVRVYTYDGVPLLYAARIYQGQTTNLRTAGGGLAAVIPVETPAQCSPNC